jgi:type IV secretion system protein VirD4
MKKRKRKLKLKLLADEASSLGQLNAIDDAIDKYRGYGIGCIFGFQSMGQLKKNHPTDEGQTLLSNAVPIIIGVNDVGTAEHFCKRLGTFTQIVESGGTSRGGSRQHSSGASQSGESYTSSWNANDNWQLQARELMKADELMRLENVLIAFPPSMPPVAVRPIRHFQEKPEFFRRSGRGRTFQRAMRMLVIAGFQLAVSASIGVAVTLMAAEEAKRQESVRQRQPIGFFQNGFQGPYVPAPVPYRRYR